MASYRLVPMLLAFFVGLQQGQACAAGPLHLPEDVRHVLALRYPRNAAQLRLIQDQVQRAAQQVMPATVSVQVGSGMGSGVIITPEGLVLTAGHVVGKANRRVVLKLPDGRKLRGRTLGADHQIDAGMVQIVDPPADLPFLPLAKKLSKVGDWVITTGHPGGIVSGRDPPLRLGRVLGGGDDWICTDCTLVGGDSGGPLINLRGEVLAVHSSIGSEIVHNFHIPVVAIKKNWKRLLASEVWGNHSEDSHSIIRPMLGVQGRTFDGKCLITQVISGLPADGADLRVGDIVRFLDDDKVTSFERLTERIQRMRPGQTVQLRIEREGELFEIKVKLAGVRIRVPKEE